MKRVTRSRRFRSEVHDKGKAGRMTACGERLFVLALCAATLSFPRPVAAQSRLAFNGFVAGGPLRAFVERADSLATGDPVRCTTSRRTAKLMECGTRIRDTDGTTPYISVFAIAGRIAMLSVIDSGSTNLTRRWQTRLSAEFGAGVLTRRSMIQWVDHGVVARYTWRGDGSSRWVSLTITDDSTMAEIARYLAPRPHG